MLKRLAAYLLGQVRIEVTRGKVETFLNLAIRAGIDLWAIVRTAESVRANLSLPDFYRLRAVARGARCRVRILGRRGFPFALARLKRRPVLIAGAVAVAAFIYWASGHIWLVRVKITGPQNLDPRAVEAVAAEAGLKPGAWNDQIDVAKVQAYIQQKMGEVSWAVIRVQGTRATIEVVEKAAHHAPNQVGCVNLVARKDGVVEQVVPFQGEPLVKRGATVKKGDPLVECSLRYWTGGRPAVLPGLEKPPRDGIARTLVAQARVMARVSYREFQEIPRERTVSMPTGQKVTQWVWNWKQKPILQQGQRAIPYADYRMHQQTYSLPGWRNWKLPLELVRVEVAEVQGQKETVSLTDAIAQAKQRVTEQLRWILGPADRVLAPVSVQVVDQGKEFIGIRVFVDTLEEITEPREGTPPAPPQPRDSAPPRP